jgi:CO/xanthine dehydrogenase Mo-binding subunit
MCLEKAYTESGYATKKHAPGAKTLPDGRMHGIAITGHIDSHGGVSGATRGGIVTITPDGKCLVNVGGARGCEGGPTMCCHVVAEALGMVYADVRIGDWGNTDTTLDAGIQAGSGFTGGAGSAFIRAALDARSKLFAAAVTKAGLKEITGITPADLDANNSEVFYTKDPTKKITYRTVMAGTGPIAGSATGWNSATAGGGQGLQRTREGLPAVGTAVNTNGGAAAAIELAVDPDTGEVEILGMWNCVDTGRTIFKRGTIKEMNSGNELMVWQCLYAGDVFDPATAALIGTHYDETMYTTTMDMDPTKFKTFDIESDDMAGPYGAHGIGEPCVTNYAAIINAIYNATGKWVDLRGGPLTPDIVLTALGKATIATSLLSR